MVRIETVYQTKNRCYQAAKPANHIGILVHATDGSNRNLKRYVDAPALAGRNQYGNHWNNPFGDKCMHAFLGLDKNGEVMVIQTLPYDYSCWGCGAGDRGSYNYDPVAHIQFEICQGSNTDSAYYRKAIAAAEEYCAYLCRMFSFGADDIVSHHEAAIRGYASDHADPDEWMENFGDSMDKFRIRVGALLEQKPAEEVVNMAKYIVTGTRLALREKPSSTATVLLRMDTGTEVAGEAVSSEWVKITYGGKIGYSMRKYLQEVAAEKEEPTLAELETVLTDKEKLDRLWEWYQKEIAG